jgi:hypothetical protein
MLSLVKEMLSGRVPVGHYGLLAEFESATALYGACEGVRDAGYQRWDAHSPFPVHGLERAMGLKPSPVPWIVLGAALAGAGLAFLLQWWVSVKAYPLVISGKPLNSWPAFVPVTFELGVLLGSFGAVFGMLGISQLPQLYHSLFRSARFERVTDDAFFISIQADDPRYEHDRTVALLERLGATHVELVEH